MTMEGYAALAVVVSIVCVFIWMVSYMMNMKVSYESFDRFKKEVTDSYVHKEVFDLSITQIKSDISEIKGDVIEMQPGETLPFRALDFPRRGMTMEKVKNELGEPLEISDAIGKPPITTWTYKDRVVYFEYSSVVHVVAVP